MNCLPRRADVGDPPTGAHIPLVSAPLQPPPNPTPSSAYRGEAGAGKTDSMVPFDVFERPTIPQRDPSLPPFPVPPDVLGPVSSLYDAECAHSSGTCARPSLKETMGAEDVPETAQDRLREGVGAWWADSVVSTDDRPHSAVELRWLGLLSKLVISEGMASLPSRRVGEDVTVDPDFEHAPCNGHGAGSNGWKQAVCPCQDYLPWGTTPVFLLGRGRDPHEWSNCGDPWGESEEHDEESCEAEESAEDDVTPHANTPHWWRWHPRFRRYLRHGVRLPWVGGRRPPPFHRGNYDTAADPAVYREFCRLRALGYLQGPYEVDDRMHVVVTTPVGAVAKKGTTKPRIIVDFSVSKINDHLPAWSFSLPDVEDVLRHVHRPGMYAASLDLGDAFLHVPTHPDDRPWWAVEDPTPPDWRPDADDDEDVLAGYRVGDGGRVYRWTATGFGCSLSPFFFCKPIQTVVEILQRFGVPWEEYVDDAIVFGNSPRQVMARVAMIRAAWSYLGLHEKLRKFTPPSTCFTFLGLEIDTEALVVRYPSKKKKELLAKMETFRATYGAAGTPVPRKELASLIGKISFAAHGVRSGRVYTRRLYQAVHRHIDHLTIHQRLHMSGSVQCLDDSFWRDFTWWQTHLPTSPGRRFFVDQSSDLQYVWGDASKAGYGATWFAPDGPVSISCPWEEEMRQASSNLRELATFEEALLQWGDAWPHHSRILYSTDNTATAKALNSGYANSDQLMEVVRRVHGWAADRDITILSRWVPGWRIIAHGEDGLSRAENFVAPPDVQWELDTATSAHWSHLGGTAARMPRFRDLDRTIRQALVAYEDDHAGGATTIIVPDWPTASWYPLLRRFRPWHRYEAGAGILRRPGAPDDVIHTRHPLLVLRLGRPGELGLTRNQRRRSRPSSAVATASTTE